MALMPDTGGFDAFAERNFMRKSKNLRTSPGQPRFFEFFLAKV